MVHLYSASSTNSSAYESTPRSQAIDSVIGIRARLLAVFRLTRLSIEKQHCCCIKWH